MYWLLKYLPWDRDTRSPLTNVKCNWQKGGSVHSMQQVHLPDLIGDFMLQFQLFSGPIAVQTSDDGVPLQPLKWFPPSV